MMSRAKGKKQRASNFVDVNAYTKQSGTKVEAYSRGKAQARYFVGEREDGAFVILDRLKHDKETNLYGCHDATVIYGSYERCAADCDEMNRHQTPQPQHVDDLENGVKYEITKHGQSENGTPAGYTADKKFFLFQPTRGRGVRMIFVRPEDISSCVRVWNPKTKKS